MGEFLCLGGSIAKLPGRGWASRHKSAWAGLVGIKKKHDADDERLGGVFMLNVTSWI